ncbi:MAG TPA: ATP synthase subunit I [Clostridiales bacterium]|nr:ATP synthase subunit I [Clostridiales bacterium]
MKVDTVVKKETINIGIGIIFWSILLQIIFMIIGRYSLPVLFGTIYGGIISLLNFFLMGLSIQKITKIPDKNKAKMRMQASYATRQLGLMILVGFGLYMAVNYEIFHWIPIVLAVLYPRLTIAFGGLFRKEWRIKKGDVA